MQMVRFPLKEAAVCICGSLHVHANLAVFGGSVATCEVKIFLKKKLISKQPGVLPVGSQDGASP